MSHYNLIYEMNPESISEEHHRTIAKQRMLLNNKRRCEFDSADYMTEKHLAQAEHDRDAAEQKAMNPPMLKKKAPLIKTSSSTRRVFDSADYYMGKYEGQNLQEMLHPISE